MIIRDSEILDGALIFKGTRVPVQALLDYLVAGDSVMDFLDDFPTVAVSQLQVEPLNYAYSKQDLAGIDEGIAQAEQGLHVYDCEVEAFFDGWKDKFKAV